MYDSEHVRYRYVYNRLNLTLKVHTQCKSAMGAVVTVVARRVHSSRASAIVSTPAS